MIKILRVIARLNVGGPARHVVLLNEGLERLGFATLLAYGRLGAGEGSLEALPAERGIASVRIAELGRSIRPIADAAALARLVRLTFAVQPDVVHTHTAKAGALGRIAAGCYNLTRARSRRCLVVHTFHGHVLDGYFRPAASRAIRLFERMLGGVTDRVVVLSPRSRDDMVDRLRIAPDRKVVTIPLGLDLAPLFSIAADAGRSRERFGLPAGAIVFGFVGRFVPVKDLSTLIRAFAAAAARAPTARLLLAGDGESREELTALVAALGVDAWVRFVGWQSDLASVYSAIDVAVLSSVNEGTPAFLIEAMAAGRPAIATAVGGVPDVVEDGRTGVLVPRGDVNALTDAIVRLAACGSDRVRLGAAARASVAARYGHERLAREVAEMYRAGLAEKRGR